MPERRQKWCKYITERENANMTLIQGMARRLIVKEGKEKGYEEESSEMRGKGSNKKVTKPMILKTSSCHQTIETALFALEMASTTGQSNYRLIYGSFGLIYASTSTASFHPTHNAAKDLEMK